ncbi:MAG: cytochrome c [Minwuia sp.]|nr:cytochrome c [Minwuia sp.]
MKASHVAAVVIGGLTIAALAWLFTSREQAPGAALAHQVNVTVPPLSERAAAGALVFERACTACHGANAAGGPGGPPLVHKIYEPSHHADGAFVLAVRNGVRQHHWGFGSMPPVADVSPAEIASIISYVRTLQRANGIR